MGITAFGLGHDLSEFGIPHYESNTISLDNHCKIGIKKPTVTNVLIAGQKAEKMAFLLFILLVMSATAVSVAGYGVRECPPWFEWVNTSGSSGYCVCATAATEMVTFCSQQKQTSYVLQSSCTFYDAKSDQIWGSKCPFFFPDDVIQDGMFPLFS